MSSSLASFGNPVDGGGSCFLLFRRRGRWHTMNTDSHERTKVYTGLLFVKVKIEIKQKEQLSLHKVDLGGAEELGIDSPMFILGR